MSNPVNAWGNIDNTDQADGFAEYLDVASAQGSMMRYKAQSYQLMSAKAGAHLLDLGCGMGDDTRALAELVGPDGSVTGADFSGELIAEAKKRFEGEPLPIEFRVEDAQSLTLEDNLFDSVRADRVFMHVPDRLKALAEMRRVTKPGGRIVVIDPDWDTLAIDAPNRPLTRRILNAVADFLVHPWSGRELYRLSHEAGLQQVTVAQASALVFDDLASANHLFRLPDVVQGLLESGEISAAEGEAWIASLEDADEKGTFFASLTLFTVVGVKA